MSVYDDGHTFCHSSCNRIIHKSNFDKLNNNLQEKSQDYFKPQEKEIFKSSPTPVDTTKFKELANRGISQKTSAFFNVWVNDRGEHVYPYFTKDGKKLAANKYRTTGQKGFLVQGDISKTALFGQQLFPAGCARQITITEGELDSLSVYQMTGSKFPVVSVKNAATARKDIADNFDYLNSFDKIVICFDKDDEHKKEDGSIFYPGQDAAQKVAAMFELGKVRVLTLRDAKDANDYLLKGWSEKFQKEWWDAPDWTPVGLKLAKNMWQEVSKPREFSSLDYPWDGLNKLTYGIRLSELVTLTANTGVGKTSVLKEVIHSVLAQIRSREEALKAEGKEPEQSRGIGLMFLEEANQDTLLGLMSITANKSLHLPDVFKQTSKEDLKRYFDLTYPDEKVVLWDHFGSNEIQKVLDFVRYMHNLGCKYIILDHLSIVVSDQNGDERKQLDEISTKLKQLCMELNVAVVCVIHQNRKGEIRGTAGVEQLSNIVIKLYRDPKADDEDSRNTTKVTVEKNRFCGRTGPACLLKYDAETGRLTELPQDMLDEYNTKKKEEEEW